MAYESIGLQPLKTERQMECTEDDNEDTKVKPRQRLSDESAQPPSRSDQVKVQRPTERQTLLRKKPTQKTTKGVLPCICLTLTIAVCVSLATLISCATVLGVKSSIYAQDGSVGKRFVGNEDAVLLLEYDPNIFGSVSVSVPIESQSTMDIYNSTCESLQNETNYINETGLENIISGHETYPLKPLYLLEGSLLHYNFNVTLEDTPKMSQTSCAVDMNIFNNYSQYNEFRNDPTSVLPPVQHCLTNGQSRYPVEAVNTSYYFQIVRISSEFRTHVTSITYKVEGYVYHYDTTGLPISCPFTPGNVTYCVVSPATQKKSCVLAKALSDSFTEVNHNSSLTSHLQNEEDTLSTCTFSFLGAFIVLFFGLLGVVCVYAMECFQNI